MQTVGGKMDQRVLVVDDEKEIRELLVMALEDAGCTTLQAETGEEALEILKEDNIQVQILDLQLPGINGIELCRQVREDYPIAILIAITGYASVFQIVEAREAGFDDYFVKPFQVSSVVKAVKDGFERLARWRKGQ